MSKPSGLALFAGVVLGGFAALLALGALLLASPASFVSLLPDSFADDESGRALAWIVAGLCAAAAAALTLRRGRSSRFRAGLVTVLLLLVAGYGIQALADLKARTDPTPENTCVAYSGGHQTCPGG
ncbi:hypothetical protein [Actinoplanes solisilvae]|uniref:hypothetical protein n=1 Tax=Actinoplanes solisilvae TaxID=2486853 RepID=UPI000FDA9968|nr:hypothetical protein [Actinoplanes solisilvae]